MERFRCVIYRCMDKNKYAGMINKDFAQRLAIAVGVVSAVIMFTPDANNETLLKRIPSGIIPVKLGSIYRESVFYKEILREIAGSGSSNVVIERRASSIPPKTGIIKDIGLSSDSAFWVNIALARWYGKESAIYNVIQDQNETLSGDKSVKN